MNLSAEVLREIMPGAGPGRAALFAGPLGEAMAAFEINTPQRERYFLAQVAHESLQLNCTRELWGPTAAQLRYEGRLDLGNKQAGDGRHFCGRGLLQVTGRSNYILCSRALYGDARLLETPELLEDPEGACRSAGWFWREHGLNELADDGDFTRVTMRINGGLATLALRLEFLERADAAI